MRRFLHAIELADLVESVDAGRETTVKAEDGVLDDGGQREEIEEFRELFPNIGVAVLTQALIVEAIPKVNRVSATLYYFDLHLSDLTALVVTAQNCDSVGEANLEGDEECDGLDTVVATIDVITHEQVVSVGRLTANLEELTKVMELAVDITANSDGRAHLLHVRLVDQNFFRLTTRTEKSEHIEEE